MNIQFLSSTRGKFLYKIQPSISCHPVTRCQNRALDNRNSRPPRSTCAVISSNIHFSSPGIVACGELFVHDPDKPAPTPLPQTKFPRARQLMYFLRSGMLKKRTPSTHKLSRTEIVLTNTQILGTVMRSQPTSQYWDGVWRPDHLTRYSG